MMIDKITQYKIQQAKELLLLETDVAMFLVHLAFDTIALNEKYVDVCLFEDSCSALDFRDTMPTDRHQKQSAGYLKILKKCSLNLKQNHFTPFIILSKYGIFNLLDKLVALIFSVHVTLSK